MDFLPRRRFAQAHSKHCGAKRDRKRNFPTGKSRPEQYYGFIRNLSDRRKRCRTEHLVAVSGRRSRNGAGIYYRDRVVHGQRGHGRRRLSFQAPAENRAPAFHGMEPGSVPVDCGGNAVLRAVTRGQAACCLAGIDS